MAMNSNMTVVTGFRSGTSLMMQTLKLLGVPIAGIDFHEEFSHTDLNPKGYYDLPLSETAKGINTDKYKGMGIKLYGGALVQTDPKLISKIIVCIRKKKSCVDSIFKLLRRHEIQTGIEFNRKISEYYYYLNKKYIELYLKKTNIKNIKIKYESMLKNPEKEIDKIKKFLNITHDSKEAIQNVGA
jgi:hypothetical protein